MSHGPQPLPAELRSPFRVSTALEAGATPRRMRAADLERPFWGVRTLRVGPASADETPDEFADPLESAALAQIAAYAPRMSDLGFLCDRSAARALGIPLPFQEKELVHVGVLRPHRAPRGKGVRGHQIDERLVSLREVDGMRVTSAASTWAQLARTLSVRDLVAIGDAIVRIPRQRGGRPGTPTDALGTIDQLSRALLAGRRVGIAKLREALPLIRLGSSSRSETHLRLDLLDHDLPEPELDFEIRDISGRLLGISEMAYPHIKVAVEYEGDHHRRSKQQWNRDIEKYERYAAAGWLVVRITAAHLYGDVPRAAARVRDALRRRGWRS